MKAILVGLWCLGLTCVVSCDKQVEFRFVSPIAGTGVYREPDLDSRHVLTLPFRTRVRILEQKGILTTGSSQPVWWVRIDCGGREACWASNSALSLSEPHLYFKVVTPSGLNLRAERSLQASVVATLPDQSIGLVQRASLNQETIQSKRGFWFYTTHDGKSGWLFSGFTLVSADRGELARDWMSDADPATLAEVEHRNEPFWKSGVMVQRIDSPHFWVDRYVFTEIKNPTAENYPDYCGSTVSRIVFTHKTTGRSFAWQGYAEEIKRQNFPLPGIIETEGTVCNCCCARGEVRYYLLEPSRVASIPLLVKDQESAACHYGPMGEELTYQVQVRRSGNVWYSLAKKPLCQLTPEQASLIRRGETVSMENVTVFSHVTFLRLESSPDGFHLTREHANGIPPEYAREWQDASSVKEDGLPQQARSPD